MDLAVQELEELSFFVDLSGPKNDELDGAAKYSTKEERHMKKSLSKPWYVNS
jgi:hypothetical protein